MYIAYYITPKLPVMYSMPLKTSCIQKHIFRCVSLHGTNQGNCVHNRIHPQQGREDETAIFIVTAVRTRNISALITALNMNHYQVRSARVKGCTAVTSFIEKPQLLDLISLFIACLKIITKNLKWKKRISTFCFKFLSN